MNRESKITERIVTSYVRVALNPMRGLNLDRGFYVPKNVDVSKITPEGTDLDIRVYQQAGSWFGVAFAGKANKPLWNYKFRDRGQLDQEIKKTVEHRKIKTENTQRRKQERQQFTHTLKVGDILYSSWGYDQTNVDFYQVTAVGEKSVKIREIASKTVGSSRGADSVIGVSGRLTGPEQTKIVRPGNSVRVTSYSTASPWDGKPKYQTAFGYGH